MTYLSKKYAFSLKFNTLLFSTLYKHLNPHSGEKILEIGCNRGFLVKMFQEKEVNAFGIDINPEAIRHGVAKNLSVMDATHLDFPDATFDKIYSIHTIEHILRIEKAFQEMERVLKPHGKIILIYPAEPIRGVFAIRSALLLFRNPFKAQEIHLHKLNFKKIKEFIEGTMLESIENHFPILFLPQHLTLLKKR